jgi:hypothetical protein
MLLLGIRSVARRGVTLTLTGDRLDAEMWSKMPFNLTIPSPKCVN